jgi:hypothetical protein
MRKEKILKWLIYLSGIVCLYAFIAIRSRALFNFVAADKLKEGYWDNTKYGELYHFNYILDFREKIPPVQKKYQYTNSHPSLKDADIYTFGDSFFDFARHEQFSKRLGKILNKKVYFAHNGYPLQYFYDRKFKNNKPKILIYEQVERYVPDKFMAEHKIVVNVDNRSSILKIAAHVKDLLFYSRSEQLYDALMKRSYFTTSIYTLVSTIKFRLFGYISNKTPVYTLKYAKPWLYYQDQVNNEMTSFYYKFSDAEMDTICNNVKKLETELKEKYNIYLILLPLPAKYTVTHYLINNDKYNNFLPRLYKGLDERGIKYINVYSDFMKEGEKLYYGTDSHWNKNGIDLALKKTVQFLRNDTIYYKIYNN